MKFSSAALTVLAAAASVTAQRAMIAFPTNGTDVQAGSDLLVMVARPVRLSHPTLSIMTDLRIQCITQNFQSSAQEVGIVLGFSSCADDQTKCPNPSLSAGKSILYNGPYNPQFGGAWFLPPHQNFTVKIPENADKGYGQISLTQFSLIGVSF